MRRSGRIKEGEQYKECEQCREYKKDKCDEEDKEYDVGLHVTKLPITHRAYVHIKRKLLTFFIRPVLLSLFCLERGMQFYLVLKGLYLALKNQHPKIGGFLISH